MSSQLTDLAPGANPVLLREAEFVFALARRHAMPFSVVALVVHEATATRAPSTAPGSVASMPVADPTRPVDEQATARIEQIISPTLRGTDVLIHWGAVGHYVIFCSGTGPDGAAELCRRLREEVSEVVVAAGCASFGDDGLTLEDLVAHAWSKVPGERGDLGGPGRRVDEGELRVVAHGHGSARPALPRWRRRLARRIKRIFDMGMVVVAAPFWLPSFGVVATAIKLSNPRAPVFFIQMRTGRGGRRFPMYKFRTMVPNAEALKEELREHNELKWPDFKIKHDPRITRIGRVLRKTSLDELPQLLNVLRGDMSLVGPRPTSFEPGTYEPWQTARLDVQPGVTGLWQVEGRAATRFDERIRIELDYIERQSFLLDLWILVRTVPAVLQMRGGH